MKTKRIFKTVVTLGVVLMMVAGLFTTVQAAKATKTNVNADVAIEELPHVSMWFNGSAMNDEGFLSDTWAVDDTGVSDSKYVLIGQDGFEKLRVKNYPKDIKSGDTTPCPTYVGAIQLALPDEVDNEVSVTLESTGVKYTLYFDKENSYTLSNQFLPGEYKVTEIDVSGDVDNEYFVKNNDFVLSVSETDVEVELEIGMKSVATSAVVTDEDGNVIEETKSEPLSLSNYKVDDELLKDTMWLAISVTVLFIVYGLIKYKRRKSEEIQRKR